MLENAGVWSNSVCVKEVGVEEDGIDRREREREREGENRMNDE